MNNVLDEFNRRFKTKCCGTGLYQDDRDFFRCVRCSEIKCVGECCVESRRQLDVDGKSVNA